MLSDGPTSRHLWHFPIIVLLTITILL